jgi:AcrR family transcriptional regulator
MEIPEIPKTKVPRIKNKEATMRRLIDAVGELIRTNGYTGLGVNKIAKQAGVHKKLMYRYFGTPEKLIETYVIEKDYWMVFSDKLSDQATEKRVNLQETITGILENQFNFFFSEEEMQQLILWELSGKSPLMTSISKAREGLGEKFLKLTDKHFENTPVNFRVVSALLSAGIYYMVLHHHVDEYCGIDIKKEEDRREVKRTIRQILSWAFKEGNAKT